MTRIFTVLALCAATAHGRVLQQAATAPTASTDAASCAQLQQQASQLNSQAATVSASAATLAAGGPVPQNNQAWAPWPAHAWPASQTPNAQAALQVANTVQASDESMTDLLTQMQTQGCTMSCSQLEQLIQTMQGQESTVSAAGAAAATGGKPVPANNPAWAPWPAHSWPASQKPSTQAIQSMSNQVQATDDSMSAAWQQMQQQGC